LPIECHGPALGDEILPLEELPIDNQKIVIFDDLGPVSRKPWKLLGPIKPFFVHLYVKTEKCIHLKLLV